MSKIMLIDAVHQEETRVALVNNNQVEDFDFESAAKRQLRGNIYLAKVTRVEPSLQAAFVEYGGNRHGFLAFSEIHPDYYQLPAEDRAALLKEEAERARSESDDEDDEDGDNGDDGEEETTRRRQSISRRYKIQEVIRRRQIMLVQAVKEERGGKGAALTTYLSLAGRYCVLMPNTPRGGGISRKITSATDRKRLKTIVQELDLPEGMGLIVRTAGAKRTKSELKRDYDYLLKLWDKIRELTLDSIAPCIIHQEGDLVQRAMRDLFEKDIEEVLVHGDDAYREAKDLARLLMPSQARKVKQYKERTPLFVDYGVEAQLDSIFSPTVKLKSGGYLVINQTEALVAIDVNSGKSTRERNIEATALKTNLEAAEEACRQMRLRDLAGLIVIDFIDMDESRNVRAVEKKVKDALKHDRARVQNGRISQFGLMEISRQRRRAGVLDSTTTHCEACAGTGRLRSVESASLQLLRALEARLAFGEFDHVRAEAPTAVALYLLNNKRSLLADLEDACGVPIAITSSASLRPGDFTIDAARIPGTGEEEEKAAKKRRSQPRPVDPEDAHIEDDEDEDEEEDDLIEADGEDADTGDSDSDNDGDAEDGADASDERASGDGRKRRRRGRRGGRRRRGGREGGDQPAAEESETTEAVSEDEPGEPAELIDAAPEDGGQLLDGMSLSAEMLEGIEIEADGNTRSSRRRRGRGRRGRGRGERTVDEARAEAEGSDDTPDDTSAEEAGEDAAPEAEIVAIEAAADTAEPVAEAAEAAEPAEEAPAEAKPKRSRSRRRKTSDASAEAMAVIEVAPEAAAAAEEAKAEDTPEPVAEPEPEPAPEPTPEPEASAEEAPSPEADSDASESDSDGESEGDMVTAGGEEEKPAKERPRRRGWWNRNPFSS